MSGMAISAATAKRTWEQWWFARAWMVRTDLVVVRAATLLRDGEKALDPADRKATATVWINTVVYGARGDLSLIGVVPARSQSVSMLTDARETRAREGALGDILLLAQFDGLYRRNWTGGTARLAAVGGVKLPTGGKSFSTGSTDAIVGLIFSRFGSRWWLSGDIEAQARGSSGGVNFGNMVRYDGGVAYRVRQSPAQRDLFVVLELNGESELASRRGAATLPDAGGHRLFVSPVVEFLLRPNVILEGGLQIPVRQALNGTQLGQDLRALVGFRYVIF